VGCGGKSLVLATGRAARRQDPAAVRTAVPLDDRVFF
jgi:hypothetical protein